jgi:hypothetical protein
MLSSFSSETNLTMGGGEGKQIISLIWLFENHSIIQILNVYLHV